MRITTYVLRTTTVSPTTNMDTETIVKRGRIRGAQFGISSTGGAAAGLYRWEVVMNSQAGAATGPFEVAGRQINLIAAFVHTSGASAGAVGETNVFVATDIPIQVGDVVNLGGIAGGTAAASLVMTAQVLVEEVE